MINNYKKDLIKYRIDRAKEAIEEVKILIEAKKFNAAITRIYYGIFFIINALCLIDNFSTSKHSQLIGYFNKEYVKRKLVDPKIGKFLNRAYELRTKSDYGELVNFIKEEVENYFKEMKLFITTIEKIIDKKISGHR
ncbi:MAG: HEPN domain-containing protein [Actinobacteria bacterium]|nr:HEPN domain-containing protein [Actinomycetota bacterium]